MLFVTSAFVYIEGGAIFYTAFGVAAVTGMAVAKYFGGRRGAALFATYVVIGVVITIAQAWLEEERVRGAGECCYVVRSTIEVALWQGLAVAGLLVGSVAERRAPAWVHPTRPALEAAGVYALASLPIFFLFPFYDPRVAPFMVLQAPDEWHIALVAIESAAAGLVIAVRRRSDLSSLTAVAALASIGFLTVAFADLSTWLHVPLHGWTYTPQSLVFVPLAGAGAALVLVTILRATRLVRWT